MMQTDQYANNASPFTCLNNANGRLSGYIRLSNRLIRELHRRRHSCIRTKLVLVDRPSSATIQLWHPTCHINQTRSRTDGAILCWLLQYYISRVPEVEVGLQFVLLHSRQFFWARIQGLYSGETHAKSRLSVFEAKKLQTQLFARLIGGSSLISLQIFSTVIASAVYFCWNQI